ncbi:MAG: hypothetical protein ABL879_04155 [Devosia sp.]
MTKLSFIAAGVVALASFGAMAVPSIAAPSSTAYCIGGTSSNIDLARDSNRILAQLRADGVDATQLGMFGDCLKAYVTDKDGTQKIAYFDPTTLEQIPADGTSLS